MCSHVRFDGGFGKDLLAHGTLHRLGIIKLIRMGQSNVPTQRIGMYETIAAIRTALGLQVVGLLVPQEARLGRQHLATMAHVLLLAHHHFGVTLAMLCQVRIALELFA